MKSKKGYWLISVIVLIILLGKSVFYNIYNCFLQYEHQFWKIQKEIPSKTVSLYDKEGTEKELEQPGSLYARSAALYDAEGGRILYSKNGNTKMAMASTTKIMTCIVILENATEKEIVTISSNAAKQPDVQLNVNTGEKYYLGDLLYSLMLESHNDVAVALAEHVGGSVEGFATLMNEKAKELGCNQTNFVTPNGLDATKHYTTAEELCKIAAYALENERFCSIIQTPSHTFSDVDKKRSFYVSNKNRFLQMYQGALGVKTGFTNNAGYCFVGAVKRKEDTFVSAVLASGWPPNKNYKWSDTIALIDYGVKNFERKKFFQKEIELPAIKVYGGKEKQVCIESKLLKNVEFLSAGTENEKIVLEINEFINAPIKQGEVIGNIYYYIDDEIYDTIPISVKSDVEKVDLSYTLEKVFSIWSQ